MGAARLRGAALLLLLAHGSTQPSFSLLGRGRPPLLASSGGAAPPRNRTVSLWVENTTIFAQNPPLAAAVKAHAAYLDFVFPGTDLVGHMGPASTDGYVIDARGNLLPMAPKARSLLARFVDEVHGWGLRVAPMVGTQNRPAVQPALWSLLRNRLDPQPTTHSSDAQPLTRRPAAPSSSSSSPSPSQRRGTSSSTASSWTSSRTRCRRAGCLGSTQRWSCSRCW